jgi:hypothetical protein
MKLPVTVLNGLAAAVTLVGMTGCNETGSMPMPTSSATQPSTSIEPHAAPSPTQNQLEPVKACLPDGRPLPDGCPACGRG